MNFNLRFEESDGKLLVRAKTFPVVKKALDISGRCSGQLSEKISGDFVSNSVSISGNFAQRKSNPKATITSSCFRIKPMEDFGLQMGMLPKQLCISPRLCRHLNFCLMARIVSINSQPGGPSPKRIPPKFFWEIRTDPNA